jgi:hypothetical protein
MLAEEDEDRGIYPNSRGNPDPPFGNILIRGVKH